MTTSELQAHQNDMADLRERFQRYWEQIIEPLLTNPTPHERMALKHQGWTLWREEITDYKTLSTSPRVKTTRDRTNQRHE